MNLNKVFIVGRITADPQLRTTPGGQSVTSFGVATNRVWRDKANQKQEEVEFHNVVAWGRQAEIATQFLKKGALVLIEGRLRTRSWEDKQGASRRATEIICERLQLGPRPAPTRTERGEPASSLRGEMMEEGAASARAAEPETILEKPTEDIPVVDLDEEIKPEDLPF